MRVERIVATANERGDRMSALGETLGERPAEEACRAGQQHAHARLFAARILTARIRFIFRSAMRM